MDIIFFSIYSIIISQTEISRVLLRFFFFFAISLYLHMKNTIVTSCLFRKIFADVRFVNLSANDTFSITKH